jgi:hypothetical protein
MRTFERVTGPKVDDWLVRMVGLHRRRAGHAAMHCVARAAAVR